MKIHIASPYPLGNAKGNTVTALRIASILRELGHEVSVNEGWQGEAADLLITLHAVKGAEAARLFSEAHPEGKVFLMFTGTDVYEQLPAGSEEGMALVKAADRLLIFHEGTRDAVPVDFHEKLRLIPVSLEIPEVRERRDETCFALSIIGHMRRVKDPFLAVQAVFSHPEWTHLRLWQIGEAMDEDMAQIAKAWESAEPRYRWLGGRSREEALSFIARSTGTVNSSLSEGGANAVIESMALGVPVLASDIPGNSGLLGADYPGLFEVENVEELATLIAEFYQNTEFRDDLSRRCRERSRLFTRVAEKAAWERLLVEGF